MSELKEEDIIYDWNKVEKMRPLTNKPYEVLDETLRDGIQSPSVVEPDIEDKLKLVHLMNDLGINLADVGMPAASKKAYEDTLRIVREIESCRLAIRPTCAARTLVSDIIPIIEIGQKVSIPIEVYTFIGSSPIRQYAEEWDLDGMLKTSGEAIEIAVKNGHPVCYVTEDTTRSNPAHLDRLFRHAIDHGAKGLCLCDTVGHATPDGLKRLIRFTRYLIKGVGEDVRIDWHGHNDRGLSVTNTIRAIEAGVDRVHCTALGMGERVGNAPMEQVLLNLKLLGELDNDLSKLVEYCEFASKACNYPIPPAYPLVGRDAFRTATGVHAAAIIKAKKKGQDWLADRVYSGVPASMFGKSQIIEVGPMSGRSNVLYKLGEMGVEADEGLIDSILDFAKRGNKTLNDEEIMECVRKYR